MRPFSPSNLKVSGFVAKIAPSWVEATMDCQSRVHPIHGRVRSDLTFGQMCELFTFQTMKRLFLALVLVVLWAPLASAQTLRIYHIDVEQADAALVVMPNGKTLLIDSGKNGHGSRIKAVMDLAGVTQIDAFVNSHYHEDHFGGIDDLVDLGVPVLEAYDRRRCVKVSRRPTRPDHPDARPHAHHRCRIDQRVKRRALVD